MRSPACFHEHDSTGSARLFVQAIWTDYYDGPTVGFLRCEACSRTFYFQLVDWDSTQEVRVFALAPLPLEVTIDDIAAELRRFFSEPRLPLWPVWVVGPLRDKDTYAAAQRKIADFTAGLVPQLIVAWRRSDDLLLRVRLLGSHDVGLVPEWLGNWVSATEPQPRDWFQFLSLVRG